MDQPKNISSKNTYTPTNDGPKVVGPPNQNGTQLPNTPILEYKRFENEYSHRGAIKAQASTAQKAYPVPNVKVEISKPFPSGEYIISTQTTDISGLTEPVALPAPSAESSTSPNDSKPPYFSYNLRFTHPDFTEVRIYNVPVFENIISIQPVELIPKAITPLGLDVIQYTVHEPDEL
ncbi:MAG: hypothetical protein RR232_04430 [Clostridia bacterium]